MIKLQLFLLFALLLTACSDDDKKEEQPTFVTNITITDADKTFAPGDAVTVKADGFQSGDQVILDIYWPIADNPLFPEGYSRYNRAVTTEQTSGSITFLAPGHCPASRVEIFLEREGNQMKLGQISVSDGQPPKEFQLYGITNYPPAINETNRIEQISLNNPNGTAPKSIVQLPKGQSFSLVVNSPGSNTLCGILEQDGQYTTQCFDLSMRYWKTTEDHPLTLCSSYDNKIMAIRLVDEHHLAIDDITSTSYTRSFPMEPHPTLVELPEGLKPESLGRYPGVQCNGSCLLLSADNGDGTFSPAVIYANEGKPFMRLYDSIKTDALIPFQLSFRAPNVESTVYIKAGGYAISKPNGGDTELRLWKVTTEEMEEPFATYPNPVRSVTTSFTEDGAQLYALFEAYRSGWLIYRYDLAKKEWEELGFGYPPYTEIVLAR